MPATKQNLTLDQGATFFFPIRWNYPSSAPVDLTGFRASMDVRAGAGDTGPLICHFTSQPPPTGLGASTASGGTLATGITVYYVITALIAGADETQPSAEVDATPSGGNLSVALTWSVVAGAAGYKVYRGTNSGGENTLVATILSPSATAFTDTGPAYTTASPPNTNTATIPAPVLAASTASGGNLTSGTTLYYTLTALTALGETTASAEQSATPSGGNLSVSLTWSAITGATGYRIYRGTSPGSEPTLLATIASGSATAFTDDGATLTTAYTPLTNTAYVTTPTQTAPALAGGGSLTLATPYYWVITATTAAGETWQSNEVTLTPSGGNQTGTLNWNAVAGASGYKVYRSTTSGSYGPSCLVTTIGSGATVTYNDTGGALSAGQPPGNTATIDPPAQATPTLANGGSLVDTTTYYYVMTSLTAAGQTAQSAEVSVTAASPNLTAVLTWTTVTGATGYNIYRSTTSGTYGASSLLTTINSGATATYSDPGASLVSGQPPTTNTATIQVPVQSAAVLQSGGTLVQSQAYYWVVTAVTANGETPASGQQTVTASAGHGTSKLTWTAVSGAVSYNVYRATASGAFGATSLVASVGSGVTYTDTGTAAGAGQPPGDTAAIAAPTTAGCATATTGGALAAATYYYAVTALTASGETAPGTEQSQATTGSTSKVTTNWSGVSGATGFNVYRGTSTGNENVLIATVGASATSFVDFGASLVTQSAPTSNTAAVPAPAQTSPSTGTTGGALAAVTYYYVVTALTAAGETTASAEKSQATTGAASTVTVNWSAVTGATGYKVYRGTTAGREATLLATLGSAATSYVDYGAAPTTTSTAGSATVPPGTIALGGPTGNIIVEMAPAATINVPAGSYSYDLFLTSPNGGRTRLVAGACTVPARTTEAP
jgi:hypothetical protein